MGSGILLQRVHAVEQLQISFNRCFDNQTGYGVYMYDTGGLLDNNESYRNGIGGFVIAGNQENFCRENQTQLTLRRCSVYKNGESGMSILDYSKGFVKIIQCRIFENAHSGLVLSHIKSTSNLQNKADNKQIASESILGGLIEIENSEIFRNQNYGLQLSQVNCTILETVIVENQQGAVYIKDEESKKNVKFKDMGKNKLRNYVHGFIGGPWGEIYSEKSKACGFQDGICVVF